MSILQYSCTKYIIHVQNSGIIRYLTLSSFPFSFKASSDVITDEGLKLDQQQHSSSIIILMSLLF